MGVEELLLPAVELVLGSDRAEGRVQPDRVVVGDALTDDAAGVFQGPRRSWTNTRFLVDAVPAVDLAVALRVGAGPARGMPQRRRNSVKSRAPNCGPLSERMRGLTPGKRSRARCRICSTSASVMVARISQWTRKRLQPSRMLHW